MKRIRLLALISIMGVAASVRAADWPLFRGNPFQDGTSEEKLPAKLEQLWTAKTGDSIDGAPAIVDGVVYVASESQFLYALNLADGQTRWKYKAKAPIKTSPAVRKGRVYIGDLDGNFVCLDAAEGKELWTFQTQSEISSGASFLEDKVLFGSADENLYCVFTKGQKIWVPSVLMVLRLDIPPGTQAWVFKVPGGPVMATPAVNKNLTFVSGCDSKLHAVDVRNGQQAFEIEIGGQTGATPALRDGMIYVGTMSNQVLAIDIAKKDVKWVFESPRGQPFFASAALTDKLVIAGSRDKRIYALNRTTGKPVWSFVTEGRIEGSPVIVGSRVYAGSMDEHLYVIDLNKGTEIQRIKLDSPVTGSIAVAGGRLLVGVQSGTIYCFGAK